MTPLRIRNPRPWFRRSPTETTLPFSYSLLDRRLELSFPAFAKVSCRSGAFRWTRLHDGSQWAQNGILIERERMTLVIPMHTAVWIEAQGQSWILDWPTPETRVQRIRSLGSDTTTGKYFVTSLALHATLLGSLLGVRILHQYWVQSRATALQGKSRMVDIQLTAGPGGLRSYVPFTGISFSSFKVRKAQEKQVTDAELALAALQGMEFKKDQAPQPSPRGGGNGGDSRTALQQQLAQAQNSQTPTTGLSDQLDAGKFKGSLEGKKAVETKPLTSKDQALVRERFRAMQEDFKRVYSRTLSIDPSLSLTIVFAAEVTPSGYLKLASFDARGTYTSEGLSQLRTGIAAILQSTRVDPRLTGTVIRGENVFVR